MQRGRAEVFLYGNVAGEFVGYATHGISPKWPMPEGARRVHHIVALGINKQFRRKPDGPREERYARQILDDMISYSRDQTRDDILPILTLFVHPENIGAKRLYADAGFKPFPNTYTDKESGIVYEGMAVSLAEELPLLPT